MNDPVPINSIINEDPIEESDNDDVLDDIKQTEVEDHHTETTGVEDHKSNNITEPEHEHRRSNQIRIPNQGVEQTGDIKFEYINLQGTFGDLKSYSTEEKIV